MKSLLLLVNTKQERNFINTDLVNFYILKRYRLETRFVLKKKNSKQFLKALKQILKLKNYLQIKNKKLLWTKVLINFKVVVILLNLVKLFKKELIKIY